MQLLEGTIRSIRRACELLLWDSFFVNVVYHQKYPEIRESGGEL
jgi:hypothetical protein